MNQPRAGLVVGATGVTGTPMVEQLLGLGWKVYGLSRRSPVPKSGRPLDRFVHLRIDLTDPAAVAAALAAAGDVSHVFYCAADGSRDVRLRMLGNLLDGLAGVPGFRNINLLQGMKYYGGNLGRIKTPAEESDPRVRGGVFYYAEEDMVVERQAGSGWTWTALRPHAVCGYAEGNPLNLAVVIAVYASIMRRRGDECPFPGTVACFGSLLQVVDAELLARAAIHVSTTPGCGNKAYNINNGDIFRWQHLWPELANWFGLRPAGPSGGFLADVLAENGAVWQELTETHRLRPFPYERVTAWVRGDYQAPNSRLACEHDIFADTVRLRRTGFCEALDSRSMFLALLERLRREWVIP